MEALNRGLLHRAIHAFDLAVGPGVSGLGKALLNTLLVAELTDRMAADLGMVGKISKLNPIVGQYLMYLIGNLGQHPAQEIYGDGLGGLRV